MPRVVQHNAWDRLPAFNDGRHVLAFEQETFPCIMLPTALCLALPTPLPCLLLCSIVSTAGGAARAVAGAGGAAGFYPVPAGTLR